MERFWSKVDTSGDCWEWLAYRQPDGYGTFKLNGSMRLAHRIAYELVKGPIPEGLQLDHLCRNRGCVNPSHLEPVTLIENQRRSPFKYGQLTHCPHGHPFSEENTLIWRRARGTVRICRTCNREQRREQYRRNAQDPAFREKERQRIAAYRERQRFARTGPDAGGY